MPIEIRELIIKTTVEKNHVRATPMVDNGELKKEILAACKQMIKRTIKENKER